MSAWSADTTRYGPVGLSASWISAREPAYLFQPIYDALVNRGDYYFLLADFDSYIDCQAKVSACFKDQATWTKKSIYNAARMGFFSSDRTIEQYAREIWGIKV